MNEKMDVKEIQDVLKTFSKESMKADMNQEMVTNETIETNCNTYRSMMQWT